MNEKIEGSAMFFFALFAFALLVALYKRREARLSNRSNALDAWTRIAKNLAVFVLVLGALWAALLLRSS